MPAASRVVLTVSAFYRRLIGTKKGIRRSRIAALECPFEDERPPCPSEEDFLCDKCQELLMSPVVGSCGHSFCAGCYLDIIRTTEAYDCVTCPACDESISSSVPEVCKRLQHLVQKYCPVQCKIRDVNASKDDAEHEACQAERKGRVQKVPRAVIYATLRRVSTLDADGQTMRFLFHEA